ncbi:MAG TPA: hypothetical protein VF059_07355 [Casimicrobiaceae bacterium]
MTRSYAAARAPRALAKAGFEVTLLTPRHSLAEASRFVTRVAHLPDGATTRDWVHALAATVKATSPALVMPCDDTSFRLLAMLVVSPPRDLQPALQLALAELICRSLGDPEHYGASVDGTLLSAAATAADVQVPVHRVVATPEDAQRFAAEHDYPVVVGRPNASAGDGVRIAANSAELARTVAALAARDPQALEAHGAPRILIRKHIDGHLCCQDVAASQGRVLGGYAGDRLQAHGGPLGPGTVVRYRDAPALRAFSQRLVAAFGMTGLLTSEYLIERGTLTPYLLEINRRIGPGTHHGAVMDVDLCAALNAAMHGVPSPTRSGLDAGEERVFVHFPGEWLRDPTSRWLRRHPVDVPWDDPQLLEAMLALRRAR